MFSRRAFGGAVAACLLALAFAPASVAQGPGGSLTFRNDTKNAVIVQGTTVVNGMMRRGQPILVAPGRTAGDFNLPPGPRLHSVYDAAQPSRVLARDVNIAVVPGRTVAVVIRQTPAGVLLMPDN